jgi:hypothetical protein
VTALRARTEPISASTPRHESPGRHARTALTRSRRPTTFIQPRASCSRRWRNTHRDASPGDRPQRSPGSSRPAGHYTQVARHCATGATSRITGDLVFVSATGLETAGEVPPAASTAGRTPCNVLWPTWPSPPPDMLRTLSAAAPTRHQRLQSEVSSVGLSSKRAPWPWRMLRPPIFSSAHGACREPGSARRALPPSRTHRAAKAGRSRPQVHRDRVRQPLTSPATPFCGCENQVGGVCRRQPPRRRPQPPQKCLT